MARSRYILTALIVSALSISSDAAITPSERAALVALHEATGGEDWIDRDNWLGAAGSECAWIGVTCDSSQSTVVRVILRENNLTGSIPDDIALLSGLVELDLSQNLIEGTIPDSIGALNNLRRLALGDNLLKMPLPASLFSLMSLEALELGGNLFDGSIPPEIGTLAGLESIDLSSNAFRGEVPPSITNLTNLSNGGSDVRFNALAANGAVSSFLDSKQIGGDWEATQTVPPNEIGIDIDLGITWTPIRYDDHSGTYRVTVTTESGSTVVFATPSKSSSSLKLGATDVVGSLSATIQAVTERHGRQKNALVSEPSASVDFSIFGFVTPFPFLVVGAGPEPLIQIGGVPQNDTFFTIVNAGTLETSAALETSGEFFTVDPTGFPIDAESTRRIELQSVPQPTGEYAGNVVITGDGAPDAGIVVPIHLLSLPAPADADGIPQRRRVDLVGGRSAMTSSAVFKNDGEETLSGIVESDVPWIEPLTETISIDPGESATIEFRIEPEELPDSFSEEGVSFVAALRLVYPDELELASKGMHGSSQHTTEVSTTLATVVNTVPPPVSNSSIPPLAIGEIGLLVPGLIDGAASDNELFADVSIANSFGTSTITDLEAYFSRIGGTGSSQLARFAKLDKLAALLLGAPIRTIFNAPGASGSMLVRTAASDSLLVSARLIAARDLGLLGTALPVFSSDHSAGPGSELYLAGLGSGETGADLFIQSASAEDARVTVQMLGASGQMITTLGPIEMDGWESVEIDDFVSAGAVTAVVRNESDSAGPIVAHALARDETSGDFWIIADWASYWGELRSTPVLVPVARHIGPSSTPAGRRRPVRRPGTRETPRTGLNLTLFNVTTTKAAAKLMFHPSSGETVDHIVRLAPRETVRLTDVIGTVFEREGTSEGYLRVIPVRGELAVTARIVTTGGIDGTVGSTVPIHPTGTGMRLGQRSSIAALDDSRRKTIDAGIGATWRTTIALLETSGSSVTVRARIRISTGSLLSTAIVHRDFEIGPNQLLRLGRIGEAIMGQQRETAVDDLRDVQVELQVIGGDGSVVVVAEMIENATGDSIIRFD